MPLQPMIRQNVKVRTFGVAWPCTKTFAVNAHPHSPSTARLAIKFISCASTCHASSPLWLYPCMHPATGVPKQKNADNFLSHDVLGARRRGLGSGRPRTCTFRHVHAKMRWLFRALLPAAHVAPTVSLHTPFVDSNVSKKRHQRATLLESAVFFYRAEAPQSPSALLAGVVAVLWLL